MPIDYSKWDNLDVSSSEDEDDESTPRVTRLDAPSRVTFGGKTNGLEFNAASPAVLPQPPLDATTKGEKTQQIPTMRPSGDRGFAPPSWTEHGGLLETTSDPKRRLYWAQDRYSVTLRLELVGGEKVRSVDVEGILPYSDRWSAVGSIKQRISCISTATEVLLDGELPHPVHLAEEDSEDGVLDWSVEDSNSVDGKRYRFLAVTLHKAVPMQGVSLWWRRPLSEFPEAEIDAVRGDDGSSPSSNSKDFVVAWEEAHKLFREGKQKRAAGNPVI